MGASASTSARPSFYFIGDSITEYGSASPGGGFISLLQSEYVRSVDMVNRGVAGYNTRMIMNHVLPTVEDELKHQFKPSLVTLWLGANDAALSDGPNSRQAVPLDEYRSRLADLVNTIETHLPTRSKVLLITPPTVIDSERTSKDRSNAAAGEYARACVQVAQAEGVAVLDVYAHINSTYSNESSRSALFVDGLHFNEHGNKVVATLIDAKIQEIFSGDELQRFRTLQLQNFGAGVASSSEFVPSAALASLGSYLVHYFGFD
ncbi:hypothetical protein PybrP1_012798 [[Pythium] brassicae (nom. inval.)]|nr:hypothetical protein PybrP1_012798 [[Pythium] brassicae (nom. inval.)]